MKHSIDHDVAEIVNEAADKVNLLATDPNVRTAVMKCAVRDFIWAIDAHFEDGLELSEFLETMSGLVRDEALK